VAVVGTQTEPVETPGAGVVELADDDPGPTGVELVAGTLGTDELWGPTGVEDGARGVVELTDRTLLDPAVEGATGVVELTDATLLDPAVEGATGVVELTDGTLLDPTGLVAGALGTEELGTGATGVLEVVAETTGTLEDEVIKIVDTVGAQGIVDVITVTTLVRDDLV
jgi:methyl coenzyme M reductase gamma subunit